MWNEFIDYYISDIDVKFKDHSYYGYVNIHATVTVKEYEKKVFTERIRVEKNAFDESYVYEAYNKYENWLIDMFGDFEGKQIADNSFEKFFDIIADAELKLYKLTYLGKFEIDTEIW